MDADARRRSKALALARAAAGLLLVGAAAVVRAVAPESEYDLGVDAYRSKDYETAASHWEKSVARGNADAMNNLGYLLFYGYGRAQDREAAISLWRMAAYAGHSEAQWHLGSAYESGEGIAKDATKAYAWYLCAIESTTVKIAAGSDALTESRIRRDAHKSATGIAARLSPSEIQSGRALSKDYIARYARPPP